MSADAQRQFFDTTVAVYAASDSDFKGSVARELLAVVGSVISVQVLDEFVAVARGKLKWPWDKVQEALTDIRALCDPVLPLTVETHEAALEIAARYGYHIYDALILASAIEAGCDVLYSEDMQDGQQIDGLTIRNPFARR